MCSAVLTKQTTLIPGQFWIISRSTLEPHFFCSQITLTMKNYKLDVSIDFGQWFLFKIPVEFLLLSWKNLRKITAFDKIIFYKKESWGIKQHKHRSNEIYEMLQHNDNIKESGKTFQQS